MLKYPDANIDHNMDHHSLHMALLPPPPPLLCYKHPHRHNHSDSTVETFPYSTVDRWVGRIVPWMDWTRRVESCYRWSRCFYQTWLSASCLMFRSIHLVVVPLLIVVVIVAVVVVVLEVGVCDHSSLLALLIHDLLIHDSNYPMIHNEQTIC